MRLWARGGRRPRGFYEFEWEGNPPPYDLERSTLWRLSVLGPEEKLEVERQWRMDFDAVREQDARTRQEHYAHCDIPGELIAQWSERKRPRKLKK
jgi:hypothetical protein